MIKKQKLIEIVKELIRGYSESTLRHTLLSCPLCIEYHTLKNGISSCGSCPNQVFKHIFNLYRPCVVRGLKYTTLDYRKENDENLAKFWTRVLELIKVTDEENLVKLSNEFRNEVIKIANELNVDENGFTIHSNELI